MVGFFSMEGFELLLLQLSKNYDHVGIVIRIKGFERVQLKYSKLHVRVIWNFHGVRTKNKTCSSNSSTIETNHKQVPA